MSSRLAVRSKIDQLGLGMRCLSNRSDGLSMGKSATDLSSFSGHKISTQNVATFLNSVERGEEQNIIVSQKMAARLAKMKLKVLDKWDVIDEEFYTLLSEVKKYREKFIGVNKKTGEPIMIKEKDFSLLNNVISNIVKAMKTRAEVLGHVRNVTTNITYNIENQYNNLQSLIIEAEDNFPGINKWIEDNLRKKEKE